MHAHIKQRIEGIITNIEQLPSIPEVASKILNMVNDPDVSFKKVADEISRDQAMTANILKLCNSAFFSKGKEITSVDRAIVTLGIREVKDIVIVVAAKPLLDKPIIGYDLAKGDLWRQGLVVATLGKQIALAKGRKDIADVIFTGGLMHNVGKLVLSLFVQNTFKDILDLVESKGVSFIEAEREIMGYDHQEIGERILMKWQFPHVLQAIVRHYRQPDQAPPEFRFEVSTVHVANALALMSGIGVGSDGLYHEVNPSAVKTTGLSGNELQEFFGKVPDIIRQLKDIF